MAGKFKKAKGPKGPRGSHGAPSFNENALAELTSQIDEKLTTKDHKRKNPPTEASGKQKQQKKQRDSGDKPKAPREEVSEDRDALLAEIKALGGDEDDLDLIDGVESSDEAYVEKSKICLDKGLKKELMALSKELGFADLKPAEHDDEEEEEDEVDEDDQEEEENDEDEDEDEEDDDQEKQDSSIRKVEGLHFEPRADWHAVKLAKLPSPVTDDIGPFMGAILALRQYAKTLLDADAEKYRKTVFAASSHKFLSTIMTSGTLTDKVSALTLACQESPAHNIRAFDTLMGLASKKSRAQAIGAIGALVDMLGPGTLLPSDRRLRTFQAQPGLLGTLQRQSVKFWAPGQALPGKLTEAHLVAWEYEDWLKETYFKIIQLLEAWCSDEIEYSRMRAVDFVYALLKDKPEQESNLLTLLVNKLGDRDRKISSRVSYLLLQLQNSHPGMKPIIIRSVEQALLLRSSQDHRAKYCAINTLNQTILTSKEPAVAETLLRIYFDLFVTMLKTGQLGVKTSIELDKDDQTKGKGKGRRPKRAGQDSQKPVAATPSTPEAEAADKLVSALLTGVNRAAPFVGANDQILEQHLDTLFKIAHSANFNTSIQALLLIQHLATARNLANDRFYRTLYESLLDPRLITSSKQALYLNLLLRALKNDVDVRRVKAFAKRMLQIAGLHQPPFVCGLLYVISHLRQTFPDLSTLVEVPEETEFDDDEGPEGRPTYDGRKRHPESSNAHRSCMWEVIPAQSHFHPSVSKFATALLDRHQKLAKPDMDSHGLIRFLDKFVYRNPKATDSARGASIMQPLRVVKDAGDIWLGGAGGARASTAKVNTAAFWNKKVEDVAAEDVFFHEYFQHVAKEPKAVAAKKADAEGGEEDEEEANEDEIWKALVSTQPDVDGEDADVDVDFGDDLDELDMASDDDEGDESPALDLDSDMDDDEDDEDEDEDQGANLDDDDDNEEEDGGSDGLVAPEVSDSEDEAGGAGLKKSKKEGDKRRERRKMLKGLPTFASVDDYAELLAGEEDDM
ncbi:Ribosome biogenesis protein MAK21 [Escovopsis weberi]|uniref:Ribosome biogenesis protein MAK21 n=1 Tax=Escovopsis weberi TaxID=150374 RepID=A0A0M8N1A4_ESCWE|nr:Ribosome biogenesis protein MAK21 [Escovopsis weberi]